MTTLKRPQQSGVPMSADRHAGQRDLAVLTRANHDMRSPLSVIMGVFELLEDSSSLSESERRYLKLGIKAAEELLSLADALRLHSAMERNLVTFDPVPVDLGAMARDHLESTLGARGMQVHVAASTHAGARVLADVNYLKVALGNLVRHVSAHLPTGEGAARPSITLSQQLDDRGRLALAVEPRAGTSTEAPASKPASAAAQPAVEVDDLGVLNAIQLIQMMGGDVSIDAPEPRLVIHLPAEEATPRA